VRQHSALAIPAAEVYYDLKNDNSNDNNNNNNNKVEDI
jgi:hypothetical protein